MFVIKPVFSLRPKLLATHFRNLTLRVPLSPLCSAPFLSGTLTLWCQKLEQTSSPTTSPEVYRFRAEGQILLHPLSPFLLSPLLQNNVMETLIPQTSLPPLSKNIDTLNGHSWNPMLTGSTLEAGRFITLLTVFHWNIKAILPDCTHPTEEMHMPSESLCPKRRYVLPWPGVPRSVLRLSLSTRSGH